MPLQQQQHRQTQPHRTDAHQCSMHLRTRIRQQAELPFASHRPVQQQQPIHKGPCCCQRATGQQASQSGV
jgi:hypothetical protein